MRSMKCFQIIDPGLYTTVQDQGRFGYQKFGIPVTGVLDRFAAYIANVLVGNREQAAVLEVTMVGPKLNVLDDAVMAVTGAQISVKHNGTLLPSWSAFRVRSGDIVELGVAQSGCRAYIAVSGGIAVETIMGSRSCYAAAKLGGYRGRQLKSADSLHREARSFPLKLLSVPTDRIPKYESVITLRAVPGPQDDYFDDGLKVFFNSEFTVSPDANRMGYRLNGPEIKQKPGTPQSIISEPSIPGGIQIPQNGQPIILLVEQTVGGYTKIATVISSDIHRVAQAKPGDKIRFESVNLEQAREIQLNQQVGLDRLMDSLKPLPSEDQPDQKDLSIPPSYWEYYPEDSPMVWQGMNELSIYK